MAEDRQERHPHIILSGTGQAERFRSTASFPRKTVLPQRDGQSHGTRLQNQLHQVQGDADAAVQAQRDAGLEGGLGVQAEFSSDPDTELAFERLSRSRQGIELLNVRREAGTTLATIFVPEGKLTTFERLIEDYLAERRSEDGSRSLDNKALINTIRGFGRSGAVARRVSSFLVCFAGDDQDAAGWGGLV